MIRPGVCGGVLPVRLIPATWVRGRLARLRSEGNGCSFLGLEHVTRRTAFLHGLGWARMGSRRLDSLEPVRGGTCVGGSGQSV